MGLTKIALKFGIPVPKMESFETYLFVGPHPDDLEIGCGATISKLTSLGKKVTMLICMDGRYGDGFSNGISGSDLVLLRKEEAKKSAEILGVKDIRFLDLTDGNGYDIELMKLKIAEVIFDVQPDIILGPDPTENSECHQDHINTGLSVRELSLFSPYEGIMRDRYQSGKAPVKAVGFYMTSHPNRCVSVGKHYKTQLQAIHCHESQFPYGSSGLKSLELYLRLRSIEYGIRTFSTHGEAFRILNETQMHCLPETGY